MLNLEVLILWFLQSIYAPILLTNYCTVYSIQRCWNMWMKKHTDDFMHFIKILLIRLCGWLFPEMQFQHVFILHIYLFLRIKLHWPLIMADCFTEKHCTSKSKPIPTHIYKSGMAASRTCTVFYGNVNIYSPILRLIADRGRSPNIYSSLTGRKAVCWQESRFRHLLTHQGRMLIGSATYISAPIHPTAGCQFLDEQSEILYSPIVADRRYFLLPTRVLQLVKLVHTLKQS